MAAITLSNTTVAGGAGFNITNDPNRKAAQDSKPRFKKIVVKTANTVDDGDTFTVDLADFGATRLFGIVGFSHTTEDSVIIEEAPTTSVNGTVVTVTVGGVTDNNKRVFVLYAL